MAEQVALLDPETLQRNPENPRLIFRQEELDALQRSIEEQGILVPLTVYRDGKQYFILDGERRWRCALKLGLNGVPGIVQPKPGRLQNLMMMFAIHNARRDWDPLPTALKLEAMEEEFLRVHRRAPKEVELAGLASLSRGEVRRLKKLLALPLHYRNDLLAELEKPRHEQKLTVDMVLETTRGVESLRKRGIIEEREEEPLRQALIGKFQSNVIRNTVAPRKLARLARGVERGEVSMKTARRVVSKLETDSSYSIDTAFRQSVEQVDYEHGIEQMGVRLLQRLEEHRGRGYEPSEKFLRLLHDLSRQISYFLG